MRDVRMRLNYTRRDDQSSSDQPGCPVASVLRLHQPAYSSMQTHSAVKSRPD